MSVTIQEKGNGQDLKGGQGDRGFGVERAGERQVPPLNFPPSHPKLDKALIWLGSRRPWVAYTLDVVEGFE